MDGVPAPSYDTGVAWTENILVPNPCWGDGRGYEHWALANFSKPCFRERSVSWRGAVSFRPDYVPSSLEMRAQGRTASVTFICGRTVWHGLKISYASSTTEVRSWVMGRTTAWTVGFMNNFSVQIPFVV